MDRRKFISRENRIFRSQILRMAARSRGFGLSFAGWLLNISPSCIFQRFSMAHSCFAAAQKILKLYRISPFKKLIAIHLSGITSRETERDVKKSE